MNYTSVTNLTWVNAARTTINCTVAFECIGEPIPFTASATDTEAHAIEIFNRAVDGDFGPIAAYVPPPEPPVTVPEQITMRQCRLQLLADGLLDDVDAAIAAMPSPQKEAAEIEWEYSAVVQRTSPLIAGLAPALGLDGADVDQLFISAALL